MFTRCRVFCTGEGLHVGACGCLHLGILQVFYGKSPAFRGILRYACGVLCKNKIGYTPHGYWDAACILGDFVIFTVFFQRALMFTVWGAMGRRVNGREPATL